MTNRYVVILAAGKLEQECSQNYIKFCIKFAIELW